MKVGNDCYAKGERRLMVLWQQLRADWLGPALKGLDRLGVTPNGLTFLSLVAGLAGAGIFPAAPAAGLGLIVAHVLIDGLDGPLARYQGVDHPRGSFADTMADQTVLAALLLALMASGMLDIFAGGLFLFFYTVVVLFAMARNRLGVPYGWLLRPRFILYGWLAVEIWLLPGSLNPLMLLLDGILAASLLSGFRAIRAAL